MPHPLMITAITPNKDNPKHAAITVNGKVVARLPMKLIGELGVQVGQLWKDVSDPVDEAVIYVKALRQAMSKLNRRAMSRSEMARKLQELGHDTCVRQRVLDRLEELSAIDDESLGRALIDEILSRRPAGPALLGEKLLRRGLGEVLVDRLVEERLSRGVPLASASVLVAQRMPAMADLDPITRNRRLCGLLARRGFDADTIEQALQDLPTDEPEL